MTHDDRPRYDPVRAFFGGSPLGVIMRLMLLSLLVGFVLTWMGISPIQLFDSLLAAAREAWANSGEMLRMLATWILTGAAVVVPIWLVMRLLRVGRGR